MHIIMKPSFLYLTSRLICNNYFIIVVELKLLFALFKEKREKAKGAHYQNSEDTVVSLLNFPFWSKEKLSDKIFWMIGGATLIFDTELISVNGKSADGGANSEL